jgi:hypothetical protein
MYSRSLLAHWSTFDVVTLALTVVTSSALFVSGRAARRGLACLPIFGLWQLVANLALFLTALMPVPNFAYFYVYSYSGIGENAILCFLSIEVTATLIPKKQFATFWCMALATLMLLSIGSALPARYQDRIFNATLAGDCLAGLALVAVLYFPAVKIPRPFQIIISGILVTAGIHALGTFKWLHGDLAPVTAAAIPLASLAGLALMLVGSLTGSSKRPWLAQNKEISADHTVLTTDSKGHTLTLALKT